MNVGGVEVLTLVEAGARIGVSPHTLRRSAEAGTLRADKKGKTWLVTAEEADRYARENKGRPGRKPKAQTVASPRIRTSGIEHIDAPAPRRGRDDAQQGK